MSSRKKDFSTNTLIKEIIDAANTMWNRGWAERNAGNISCLLDNKTVKNHFSDVKKKNKTDLVIPVPDLSDKAFLVSASGSYFKNYNKAPASYLGVIRIADNGKNFSILWGFEDGNKPTSEINAHLLSHAERLKSDPEHRFVIHTHATDLIAMSAVHELDDISFTRTLWLMHTECITICPEGIGVLPIMVPGTQELALKTAEKMSKYRAVIWPFHGILGTGRNIDETI